MPGQREGEKLTWPQRALRRHGPGRFPNRQLPGVRGRGIQAWVQTVGVSAVGFQPDGFPIAVGCTLIHPFVELSRTKVESHVRIVRF